MIVKTKRESSMWRWLIVVRPTSKRNAPLKEYKSRGLFATKKAAENSYKKALAKWRAAGYSRYNGGAYSLKYGDAKNAHISKY